MLAPTILQLLLVASASAAAIFNSKVDTTAISWGPCNQTQVDTTVGPPALCGELAVPLDYTNITSNKTLNLQLLKIPASVGPCKGSIQFNFGGPGSLTRQTLPSLGYTLLNLTGGQYDLVGFDTRGTGNTLPVSCVSDASELDYGLQAQALLQEVQQIGNASDTALGAAWASTKIVTDACYQYQGANGTLVGTAFVARDLISVVDALGEDGLLRYWGFSYGTTLGATVASMFPERIDKIILDGVQNPHQYYHALADFEEWTQTDYVFSSLFTTCAEAGPVACPLASLNKTGAELENMFWDFLYDLKYYPVPIGDSFILNYSYVKTYISGLLYDNSGWALFTEILRTIFTSPSIEAAGAQLSRGTGLSTPSLANLSTLASELTTLVPLYSIHFGDRTVHTDDFDTMVDVYQELVNISHVFGDFLIVRDMVGAQWQMRAAEIYNGNFTAKLPHTPMLLIANEGDAYTPVKSAYNVSSGFEGSVVLETDGFGHTSENVPSTCVLQHTSNYWSHGILPAKGTKCVVEAKPYANVSWPDVIALAKNNSAPHRM